MTPLGRGHKKSTALLLAILRVWAKITWPSQTTSRRCCCWWMRTRSRLATLRLLRKDNFSRTNCLFYFFFSRAPHYPCCSLSLSLPSRWGGWMLSCWENRSHVQSTHRTDKCLAPHQAAAAQHQQKSVGGSTPSTANISTPNPTWTTLLSENNCCLE